MRGQRAFALLMAMRTGKTKVAIDDFGEMELAGEVRDQLVIAPAGVYHTWETAIREHASDDLQDRMLLHTWKAGANKRDREALKRFLGMTDKHRPRTLLVNVEALSRPGLGRDLCHEFLSLRKNHNVVQIDESTIIKNNSKRTKFINKVIHPIATYRRILSGLATPRSPLDLFFQFEFLDWNILGFRNYYAFRAHVAIMKQQWFGGRSVQLVVGYNEDRVAELQELIEPYSFRVQFRPKVPSAYTIREVTLTKDQKKKYAELRDFATTELDDNKHVTATVVIAQIMRMHQVLCGHVRDESGDFHEIPENKTAELLECLDDYSGKAIIWCSYDYNIRNVVAALEKEYGAGSVARFWGGNKNTREAEEAQFLKNPLCRFMVATPSAGGRGRTWSNADLVIYFSSTDNLEHRDQSETRVQGVKKERGVDYIDLVTPDTIEMKILHALRKKINMASTINGDNYREWLV